MFKDISGLKTNKITNYVNIYDPIAMANAENHLGYNYTVPIVSAKLIQHSAEDMGPLEKSQYRTSTQLKEVKEHMHPKLAKIQQKIKEYVEAQREKHRGTGYKANSDKNISEDTPDEDYSDENVLKGSVEYDYYLPDYEPEGSSEDQNNGSTPCVGSYEVSGYTRADGTEVSGYVRTCGAAHNGSKSGSAGASLRNSSGIMPDSKNGGVYSTDCWGTKDSKKYVMSFAPQNPKIEWGKMTKKMILKELHKGKSIKNMSDEEFRKIARDLI